MTATVNVMERLAELRATVAAAAGTDAYKAARLAFDEFFEAEAADNPDGSLEMAVEFGGVLGVHTARLGRAPKVDKRLEVMG